ncbi:MAG: hypothetical protein Q8J78_02285 [Moraxellaceae bacterium]|nr:hypothetical protein [Moraxellaceae bacterium]
MSDKENIAIVLIGGSVLLTPFIGSGPGRDGGYEGTTSLKRSSLATAPPMNAIPNALSAIRTKALAVLATEPQKKSLAAAITVADAVLVAGMLCAIKMLCCNKTPLGGGQ